MSSPHMVEGRSQTDYNTQIGRAITNALKGTDLQGTVSNMEMFGYSNHNHPNPSVIFVA